jgi:hypothetical protein
VTRWPRPCLGVPSRSRQDLWFNVRPFFVGLYCHCNPSRYGLIGAKSARARPLRLHLRRCPASDIPGKTIADVPTFPQPGVAASDPQGRFAPRRAVAPRAILDRRSPQRPGGGQVGTEGWSFSRTKGWMDGWTQVTTSSSARPAHLAGSFSRAKMGSVPVSADRRASVGVMFYGTIHGFGSSVSLLLPLTPLGLHDARAG